MGNMKKLKYKLQTFLTNFASMKTNLPYENLDEIDNNYKRYIPNPRSTQNMFIVKNYHDLFHHVISLEDGIQKHKISFSNKMINANIKNYLNKSFISPKSLGYNARIPQKQGQLQVRAKPTNAKKLTPKISVQRVKEDQKIKEEEQRKAREKRAKSRRSIEETDEQDITMHDSDTQTLQQRSLKRQKGTKNLFEGHGGIPKRLFKKGSF